LVFICNKRYLQEERDTVRGERGDGERKERGKDSLEFLGRRILLLEFYRERDGILSVFRRGRGRHVGILSGEG
jgi:hypothetical protein